MLASISDKALREEFEAEVARNCAGCTSKWFLRWPGGEYIRLQVREMWEAKQDSLSINVAALRVGFEADVAKRCADYRPAWFLRWPDGGYMNQRVRDMWQAYSWEACHGL